MSQPQEGISQPQAGSPQSQDASSQQETNSMSFAWSAKALPANVPQARAATNANFVSFICFY
jgi:hypothetical protein